MANNGRVLIADDDSVSLFLLSKVFADGYELCCVKSGEEALANVETFKPDIIILDIVMKGIYGYEACERLKANRDTADIPVVFISSREEADAEIAGLKVGGIDFITKPFNPAVVRMRISNYIDLKRTRDNLEQMSITDQLTSLYNRRYFDRMLNSEVRRSSRSHDSIALLMMDIDRFKVYNDNNGHLAGDECLKLIRADGAAAQHEPRLRLRAGGKREEKRGGSADRLYGPAGERVRHGIHRRGRGGAGPGREPAATAERGGQGALPGEDVGPQQGLRGAVIFWTGGQPPHRIVRDARHSLSHRLRRRCREAGG
jgi:DNA-binding response OmpR family regulator